MGVKALGIAMKLTLSGVNQLVYPQTWIFAIIVATFLLTQLNYLNKVSEHFCLCSFSSFAFSSFLLPSSRDSVRSHIGWRGERSIPYKGVETFT